MRPPPPHFGEIMRKDRGAEDSEVKDIQIAGLGIFLAKRKIHPRTRGNEDLEFGEREPANNDR